MKILSLVCLLFYFSTQASAMSYANFAEQVKVESELKKTDGLSYMLSGGVALIGGGYGWSHGEKSVEKGFYSLAQSLGILAIGYGAEAYFLRGDDELFLQVLSSGDLTQVQKDRMVESYLMEKRQREEDVQWIRKTTFGLAGLLNMIYASQAKDSTLQNFLYVTAGVQLAWAFSF